MNDKELEKGDVVIVMHGKINSVVLKDAYVSIKNKTIRSACVILCILLCCCFISGCKAGNQNELTTSPEQTEILNVTLYKVLPDYESFEKTVTECWNEKHPEVELNFVDWDCYSGSVPDDLDVFVIDTTSLDAFVEKGYLLALSEEDIEDYDDLIPSFMEGCRVNGEIYVVPQLLCTDLLYTRKGDDVLENVKNIDELYAALGDSGLLLDKDSTIIQVAMYLQALTDGTQLYTVHYPPITEETLLPEAVESLRKISEMHQTDPEGVPEDSGWYYYARRFAEGMGRAYIGYSESMDIMGESASEMDFRLFSMTEDKDIPVFYVDAAAINAKISDEKKPLALEFLNMITGKDFLTRVSENGGDPRYLLVTRYGIYDALAPDYPIYAELKKAASVPDAFVFRIIPDGDAYLEEAAKYVESLPSLTK